MGREKENLGKRELRKEREGREGERRGERERERGFEIEVPSMYLSSTFGIFDVGNSMFFLQLFDRD